MKKLSVLLVLCLFSILTLTACDLSEYANRFSGFLEYLPTSSTEPSGAVGETAAPKPTENQKESQPIDTEPEADAHVHSFSKWTVTKTATCTEEGRKERTCECGEKETVSLTKASHSYTSATCDAPQTCRKCGATKGEARGHDWLPNYCLMTCRGCGITMPSGEDHAWRTFGCQNTCRGCGITMPSGEDHAWAPATCTAPQTCYSCKLTQGEPLPHSFFFNQCRLCGLIDPDHYSLEHTTWTFTCEADGKPFRWGIDLHQKDGEGNGRLWYLSSVKINPSSLNPDDGREVITLGGQSYVFNAGDDCPMTYTINGKTVTITNPHIGIKITLQILPETQQIQVVSASGPWKIPVGALFRLN